MMKKIAAIGLVVFLCGCAYGTRDIEDIKTFVTDQEYARYKARLDGLETSYLSGQITYAQYLDQKKQVQENYDSDIKRRQQKLREQ